MSRKATIATLPLSQQQATSLATVPYKLHGKEVKRTYAQFAACEELVKLRRTPEISVSFPVWTPPGMQRGRHHFLRISWGRKGLVYTLEDRLE